MAEAIVSAVLEQLISINRQGIQQEVKLVVGVNNEVKKLRSNLEAIEAVLLDAEERQLKEKTVSLWLDWLKHASYDIEDVLDEWNYAMLKQQIEGLEDAAVPKKKVCFSFPSSCFSFKQISLRHDIARKVKEVNENLDVIKKQKDEYGFKKNGSVEMFERGHTTSFVDVSEICGRVDYKSSLVRKLCESSEQHLPIISIVGMGGIGKTTIAQFAFKDNEVINNFEKNIWICVSEPFDEYRIARAIIEALEGSAPNLIEFESLLHRISESIVRKKFLLVLDDVWNEDYKKWEPLYHCLKNGLHGSKILITTRKELVARMMRSIDIINVEELPDEECWLLFRRLAFSDMSQKECQKFEEIGKQILSKCKGLPLAVKTIGSLLRFKKRREQWQSILDSELWKLEEFKEDIFRPLLLSYNDLPSMIKRCFVYCVVFPKDHIIEKDYLIKLWMAQGYLKKEENKVMEIVGEEYFDFLASRSFFQEFERERGDDNNIIRCKMHDLVHDFAQFLSKNECISIEVDGLKDPIINSSYHEQVCHVMVTIHGGGSFPNSIFSLRRIRSFLYDSKHYEINFNLNMVPKLSGELTCLKALRIVRSMWEIHTTIEEDIPKEIGKLIHLRYLNLSYRQMRKLPEELCGLYNLQTLDISGCAKLEELPQGIGKLINLRHLENRGVHSLIYIPIGIQRLTNLRTLKVFVVGNDNKACSLEGLKYLNLYGDDLCIQMLGNVSNVDEARRLELKNQKNLLRLVLNFKKDEGERRNEDDEALLEILQPPLNLEKLRLENYRGNFILSNWMMSLTNLRQLRLHACSNCKHLPPLGKLPSLESLNIWGMNSLQRVSNEFLGIESDGTSSSFFFFPKLKEIKFGNMNEWEEWDYEITRKGEEEDDITIMPSLVSLVINLCPKLKALPYHLVQNTTLEKHIVRCPLLGYD